MDVINDFLTANPKGASVMPYRFRSLLLLTVLWTCRGAAAIAADFVQELQARAIADNRADWGYWGDDPANYTAWGTHSNRLVPVYTFGTRGAGTGIDLTAYQGANSPYRSESALQRIYGRMPTNTLNPQAEYFDQTNIFDIQQAALKAGKKHIFLVIFDGMDWQTTRNASIFLTGKVAYAEGRGATANIPGAASQGLHFVNYTAHGTTQFGFMCTSPHNEGTKTNVDEQTVVNPGGTMFGGYDAFLGGGTPWAVASEPAYLIARSKKPDSLHAYTDSSSSMTSMTAGIKTFNNCVNVDPQGVPVETIAHVAQRQGYAVGAVSSVPISHATPAAAYAVNVFRDDYQDLTRDMLGLPSISHPTAPLPGMDVIIGGGYGEERDADAGGQGKNFVPGNVYLTAEDLKTVDVKHGGKYVVATRTAKLEGGTALWEAAKLARRDGRRLLGFFGLGQYKGHLPFRTANGDFQPPPGRTKKAEQYLPAEICENPSLYSMTEAALLVLSRRDKFWLMVEAGDVDWANHDNNLDNSIGAVISGDQAVQSITRWVEMHSNWKDSLLIVTADHGQYFHLTKPEVLTGR